ncbi:MAG: PEP-CTERM sorting domain-containing protein [Bryobacteraceae bacterium]
MIPKALYQIDPKTGRATLVAPTALNLSAAIDVNGTLYAFNAAMNQVVTLDLANGKTTFVSSNDPALDPIGGAAPVPEPASIVLAGIGIAAIVVCRRRRRTAGSLALRPT